MKQFRISFLVVALSLMLTGAAFAVDIPNISTWTQSMGVGGGGPGLGDLLLAPLYDVRNLTNPDTGEGTTLPTTQYTLISIVNTDPNYGVIARIRFRDWKRSREVLDFDIPLSCNDVWVAEVSRLPGGGGVIKAPVGKEAQNRWVNSAPTVDYFPSAALPAAGFSFQTTAIAEGTAAEQLARTEYGYFEIIGEERVKCKPTSDGSWFRTGTGAPVDKDVKDMLMGNVYLLRPEAAISHQYNMNAYSDFAIDDVGIWKDPTSGRPNLHSDVQGEPSTGQLGVGAFEQLEAIMSKADVMFQYVNGTGTGTPMSTSVVITFPTKHFHYDISTYHRKTLDPFWAPFTGYHETCPDGTSGGEVIKSYIYDRDENLLRPPSVPISPSGRTSVEVLCYEVNVIGLLPQDPIPDPAARGWRDNTLLPTMNSSSGQTFNEGWAIIDLTPDSLGIGTDPRLDGTFGSGVPQGKSGIDFSFFNNFFGAVLPSGQVLAGAGRYRGLPAIGIVMTEFYNDSVLGYYGNTVPWQYDVAFGIDPVF